MTTQGVALNEHIEPVRRQALPAVRLDGARLSFGDRRSGRGWISTSRRANSSRAGANGSGKHR